MQQFSLSTGQFSSDIVVQYCHQPNAHRCCIYYIYILHYLLQLCATHHFKFIVFRHQVLISDLSFKAHCCSDTELLKQVTC